MGHLHDVIVPSRDLRRFATLVGEKAVADALALAGSIRIALKGGAIWNVSSTAVGGGVAEMLQPLLGYTRGAELDTRWVVITGDRDFFHVTKRLHHALHGAAGDGTPLGEAQRRIYEATLRPNGDELAARLGRGDVVILHDPQTAGMAPVLLRAGARVIWRCHIGHDQSNDEVERGWAFLMPYLGPVPRLVFSRRAYVPRALSGAHVTVVPPSIDAFSPKNEELDEDGVRAILVHTGIIDGPPGDPKQREFVRGDGSRGRVERGVDIIRSGRAPSWDTPLVVQVSRWDPLKDMLGVLRGFARLQGSPANLVLAGPAVDAVADDPEGAAVWAEVLAGWRELPDAVRHRIHLVNAPMADVEENAVIVNALQRHAQIVVQKSLHEGFGLTVTEAMWKGRAVVASAVGGIQDQIEDGVNGALLRDPADLDSFAAILGRLLGDRAEIARLGQAARERVRTRYLGLRHLLQYGQLLAEFR